MIDPYYELPEEGYCVPHVQTMRDMWAKINHADYVGFMDWQLETGLRFTWQSPIRHPRTRQLGFLPVEGYCYENAFQYASRNPGVRYCEGFYVSQKAPIPLAHAFNVLPDGSLFDPTCFFLKKQILEWWGVPVPVDFVAKNLKQTGFYSNAVGAYYGEIIAPQRCLQAQ